MYYLTEVIVPFWSAVLIEFCLLKEITWLKF